MFIGWEQVNLIFIVVQRNKGALCNRLSIYTTRDPWKLLQIVSYLPFKFFFQLIDSLEK